MISERSKKLLDANPDIAAGYAEARESADIARQLRAWREAAHLTQQQVADGMGIDQSSVARLESLSNAGFPKISTLSAFAHACGRELVIAAVPVEKSTQRSATAKLLASQLMAIALAKGLKRIGIRPLQEGVSEQTPGLADEDESAIEADRLMRL